MASISFKLRQGKNKANKIYLHFNYGRKKQIRYSTGYGLVSDKSWDATKEKVKNISAEPKSQFVNAQIADLRSFAEGLLDDFTRNKTAVDPSIVKLQLDAFTSNEPIAEKKEKDLLEYYQWFIDYYSTNPNPATKKPLSIGTIKGYKTAFVKLQRFCKRRYKVSFNDISLSFYDDYVSFLQNENYSTNYIGKQIKILKTIMNSSFERGLHKNLDFKKSGFSKISEDVQAIYLSVEELHAIQNIKLEDPKIDRARDLFLIGAYTGLRVSDFNRLTNDNIKELLDKTKYIQITAAKTNRVVEIPINSQVRKILKKNGNKPPKSMPEQKINLALKTIGRLAKINEKIEIEKTVGGSKEKTAYKKYQLITNHTARRSFCTNAYKAGLSTIDIMAISGHKSEAVFLKYIKITPNERLKRLASHEFFN